MASSLCPRAFMPATRFVRPSQHPSSSISRCLHPSSRQTRHQRCSQSSSLNPRIAHRTLTTSPLSQQQYKSVQELKSRNRTGPVSLRSAVLFLTAGAGLIFYFRYEKERLERKKIAEQSKGVGKPKVGGKFELTDQEGRGWTEGNLKGGFTLVYFGFSHCPDICPDELDKMARMIDLVNGPPTAETAPIPPPPPPLSPPTSSPPSSTGPTASPTTTKTATATTALPTPSYPPVARPPILPLFISCDPARDTPSVLKTYLKEFHPSLVGLTGTWQQVKDVCKAYRVYFSTPEGAKPGMDYLVDHSIYFYVMGG
ncbi:MAG: hypothetical protein L6R37_003096 [Teloschistes peruensis]|nr:MAG: hypothetical protein L6R37_003096 [Teloschistes peruensis]